MNVFYNNSNKYLGRFGNSIHGVSTVMNGYHLILKNVVITNSALSMLTAVNGIS